MPVSGGIRSTPRSNRPGSSIRSRPRGRKGMRKDWLPRSPVNGELLRPALYGSYHEIVPVVPRYSAASAWDVVGPICESSDVFARERMVPALEVGDLVAVLDAGAYGSVMASNYNRHMLPPEVLVDYGQWTTIRRRQTLEDVLALES